MNVLSTKKGMVIGVFFVALLIGLPSKAHESGITKPQVLLNEIVQGMPRGEKQEISVLTASFKPGDKTVFHTHRFPVVVYVLEGTFTLALEGRDPTVVKAGKAIVEPPHIKMIGYNRSSTELLKVVIVYTGDPGTAFLDLVPE